MNDARNVIVLTEAGLALAVIVAAWLLRRRRPWVFAFFPCWAQPAEI